VPPRRSSLPHNCTRHLAFVVTEVSSADQATLLNATIFRKFIAIKLRQKSWAAVVVKRTKYSRQLKNENDRAFEDRPRLISSIDKEQYGPNQE
jgi:hypothetical protein